MPKKILIVDDEPLIVKGLKYSLEQDGYEIDSAQDGEEAVNKFFAGQYDLVLLDVMLPKLDGIEVCQRIREKSNVPIIMLTAKGDDMDKILGLEYGADDYMTKPFSVLELTARIRSLLRRSVAYSEESHGFYDGGLEIDFDGRTVHVMQKQVDLTFKEFELLKYLILHKGKAVSRQELLNQIWGYDFVGESRTLDVHINSLRRKLGEPYDGWIQVIRGVGYRFVSEN